VRQALAPIIVVTAVKCCCMSIRSSAFKKASKWRRKASESIVVGAETELGARGDVRLSAGRERAGGTGAACWLPDASFVLVDGADLAVEGKGVLGLGDALGLGIALGLGDALA